MKCHSDGRRVLRGRGGVLPYPLSPRVPILGSGVIGENTVWKLTLPAVESEY